MNAQDGLTAKQRRFVDEYLIDLNATQAAIRAGYSEKSANTNGPRMLVNVGIAAAIEEAQAARARRSDLSKDWVLKRLKDNVERAMTAEPVRDTEGRPTGRYVYQGNVANKALELIGKHLGMFSDKIIDVDFSDLSTLTDAELEQYRRELRLIS